MYHTLGRGAPAIPSEVHPLVGIGHQQLKVLRRLLGKREPRSAHRERNRGWTLGENVE